MKRRIAVSAAMLAFYGASAHAIVITQTDDAAVLVDAILGEGVSLVGTPTLTGSPLQFGTFTNGTDTVGFANGIVLSTGNVLSLAQPNSLPNMTTSFGTTNVTDLIDFDWDTAILSFDFTFDDPEMGTDVSFNYVFGSEEYLEYVNSAFTDEFQLLVGGENLALLGDDPVNVDTINTGANSSLFRDNTGGLFDIELDGLTTVLVANSSELGAGIYTALFVIADVSDTNYDSAVFVQGGTFDSNEGPPVPPTPEVPVPAAFPLMAAGLAIGGFARRRVRRV
ncbi:choice-of-anchor L domain-containing protein [Parvularcula dongshanensis]|uniref:VPLPA-CTERM sorting domain-containing protein n=1 Tax=Parvularcula dongshanensis TaxID=1173995 RepID=A0A840I388_9PROT|nr:choice-of-anchor L domain-containing protein [Parvularcula dongshanensis]MBB4658648.1 hypothetical protein [Parvularcula dongshanensis]